MTSITLTVLVLVSILTVSLLLQCRYQLLVQGAKHVSGYTLQFAQAVVVLKIDKTVNWWLHSNTDRHWPRTHTGLVSHWDAFRGVVFHLLPTSPLKAFVWETVLTLTWPFSVYFFHVKPFLLYSSLNVVTNKDATLEAPIVAILVTFLNEPKSICRNREDRVVVWDPTK